MMLAAWNDGVGSCPNGISDAEAAERIVGAPVGIVLTFGYPAKPRDPKAHTAEEWSARANRKPFDDESSRELCDPPTSPKGEWMGQAGRRRSPTCFCPNLFARVCIIGIRPRRRRSEVAARATQTTRGQARGSASTSCFSAPLGVLPRDTPGFGEMSSCWATSWHRASADGRSGGSTSRARSVSWSRGARGTMPATPGSRRSNGVEPAAAARRRREGTAALPSRHSSRASAWSRTLRYAGGAGLRRCRARTRAKAVTGSRAMRVLGELLG